MATNHWLKKFKEVKKTLQFCRVSLFEEVRLITGDFERIYLNPSKPLALEVSWDSEEFGSGPEYELYPKIITGVGIHDERDVIIWTQIWPSPIVLKKSTLKVDFHKTLVEGKWSMEQFFTDD